MSRCKNETELELEAFLQKEAQKVEAGFSNQRRIELIELIHAVDNFSWVNWLKAEKSMMMLID
jgi:hypothetical protein